MKHFREKGFIWIGMALALCVSLVLFFSLRGILFKVEAESYGNLILKNLVSTVSKIDHETKQTFTPDLYEKLHRKNLSQLKLYEDPSLKQFVLSLRQHIHNTHGAVVFFTDCPEPDKATCYEQLYFTKNNPEVLVRKGYEPKSRPWYLATRAHSDWVAVHFMIRSRTRESGYPTTWGVGLVKHLMANPEAEAALKIRASQSNFSKNLGQEEGIWIMTNFSFPSMDEPGSIQGDIPLNPFLNTIFGEDKSPFLDFELIFKTLRFPPEVLSNPNSFKTDCQAITSAVNLDTYKAHVRCEANGEPIQFSFTSRYHHPFYLIFLALLSLLLLFFAFRLLSMISRLKKQEVQTRQKKRYEELLEKIKNFPRIEPHDLLPLSKVAYQKFVNDKYGSFPKMATKTGLDLNNIYRINRRYKNDPFVIFKYETILEMVGSYDSKEREGIIKNLLCSQTLIQKLLRKK